MTTQKEFHEMMKEIENLLEKHKDFTSYEDSEYGECIRKSAAFVPLAIDQIKRLERAMLLSISTIEIMEKINEKQSLGARSVIEQIKKELGE